MKAEIFAIAAICGTGHSLVLGLSGKVFDETGRPVFNASVSLSRLGLSTVTGPDGNWQLTGVVQARPEDPDTIVYLAEGLAPARDPVVAWEQKGLARILSAPRALPAAFERVESYGTGAPAVDSAKDVAITTSEQGAYARQSVSHLGILLSNPKARRDLVERFPQQNGKFETIQAMVLTNFRLPRFDDNPLPPAMSNLFGLMAERLDLSPDNMSHLIDYVLVPKIQAVADMQKRARAAQLQTEEQKNSFYTQGLKNLDLTMSQVRAIENSSWVYVPVLNSVDVVSERNLARVSVSLSLLWYHIRKDQTGIVRAVLEHNIEASGTMSFGRGQYDAPGNAEELCFQSALSSAFKQLLVNVREVPAFNLSSQVLEVVGQNAVLDIGRFDGVKPNDQYALLENVQEAGKDVVKQVGWVKITSRDSANRSNSRIVSGVVYPGLAVKEIADAGVSIDLDYLWHSQDFGGFDATLSGVQLDFVYGTSWWYGFSGGFGIGRVSGKGMDRSPDWRYDRFSSEHPVDAGEADWKIVQWDVRLALRQMFPLYRRWNAYLEPEIGGRYLSMASDKGSGSEFGWEWGSRLGLEFAVAPSFSLQAFIGFSKTRILSADNGTISIDNRYAYPYYGYTFHGGRSVTYDPKPASRTIGLQIHWTPKALWFDPATALLGAATAMGSAYQNQ